MFLGNLCCCVKVYVGVLLVCMCGGRFEGFGEWWCGFYWESHCGPVFG